MYIKGPQRTTPPKLTNFDVTKKILLINQHTVGYFSFFGRLIVFNHKDAGLSTANFATQKSFFREKEATLKDDCLDINTAQPVLISLGI